MGVTPADLPDWTSAGSSILPSITGTVLNVNDSITLLLTGQASVEVVFNGGVLNNTDVVELQISPDGLTWVGASLWAYGTFNVPPPPIWVPAISGALLTPAQIGAILWRADVAGALQCRLVKVQSSGNTQQFTVLGVNQPLTIIPPTPSIFKEPAAAVFAQGAGLAIWTPPANRRWWLQQLEVASDVTGELLLLDGAAQIRTIDVSARLQVTIPFPGNGRPSSTEGNVLTLNNNTGVNAGLHASAQGYETG
jgi:hypothetical protein